LYYFIYSIFIFIFYFLRLFEDLSYYERTLEEMAQAKLDDNFLEELTAIEQWFNCLSNCEKTTALYSLLQQATPVQVRFFITVLQQKAQKETPGNVVDKSKYKKKNRI